MLNTKFLNKLDNKEYITCFMHQKSMRDRSIHRFSPRDRSFISFFLLWKKREVVIMKYIEWNRIKERSHRSLFYYIQDYTKIAHVVIRPLSQPYQCFIIYSSLRPSSPIRDITVTLEARPASATAARSSTYFS